MIGGLIRKNRSCRRFYQNNAIGMETLEELVNLARLSASAANLQPLNKLGMVAMLCRCLLLGPV